jgi:phosphatidylglycerol:prolipoprotein diacylglycerol transferase
MKRFYWISAITLALVLVSFVFIPAFAGKLSIPSEISFGNYAIRLYGVTLALAILAGYLIARNNSWRFGISKNEIDDIAFWLTIVGILGARIYYVAFEWNMYSSDYSEIYKIWHGGLSIYGAILAGIIYIVLYARKKAYSVYQLLDLITLSLPVSQAIGRFGNFFNQEAFGVPTNLPWKMYVSVINRPSQYSQNAFFHPAFLYEVIWNLIVFFILVKFLRGKVKPGVLALSYIALYSFGRFFIEGIRIDSSYLLGLRVDQITALIGIVIASSLILLKNKKSA